MPFTVDWINLSMRSFLHTYCQWYMNIMWEAYPDLNKRNWFPAQLKVLKKLSIIKKLKIEKKLPGVIR